ncbi:DUF6461 domain-containing protein [Streptomyces mayonensis]|uniref:DUF6461 domain-containing protein n=1 Tax=Streptomyces mayonensis TaxID=2750816 RepID=UPI0027E53E6B|nr:DUF6461 domain-containing protein [Streptomyces sp. A108]
MTECTTAADYTDIFGTDDDFGESHCFTYVQAIRPEELLRELKAPRIAPGTGTAVTGLSALREWTNELYRLGEHTFEEVQPVGVVPVGDWTLMVEYNGFMGTEPEVMLPVTRGRTAVSHMANVSPVGPFYWYVDGAVRMSYDEDPYLRSGDRPDGLLDVMRAVGFGPMEDPDEDWDEDADEVKSLTPAKFALAHHVTGVRLTRRLLETAEFTCGLVTKPVPSWLRA